MQRTRDRSLLSLCQAVVLTMEPEERLCRNLSSTDCALLMSPVPSAEPICESNWVKLDELSDEVAELDEVLELSAVLLVDELLLVDEVLLVDSSRLVSES